MNANSLKNSLLISMPSLLENKYKNSLIYLCHQGEYGSMGIILNQKYNMDLSTMLQHLDIDSNAELYDQPVYCGGEIQSDRGFILHPYIPDHDWLSSYRVNDELNLTSSADILEAMAVGNGPEISHVSLGYIGWGPGELETEIIDNLWLNCPVNLDIIFTVAADDKLQAAASLIGVNLDSLTSHSGKA
jgi:putative transcriptional regulator